MFCRTCGKQIIDEAVVCPYCGCLTGVPQQPPIQNGNQFVDKNGRPCDQYGNPISFDQNGNPISFDRYGNPNNPYSDRYGNHNTTPIVQQNMNSEPDEVNAGLIVLSVLMPIVGIILGAINQSSGKRKSGKTYLFAGVISWGVQFFLCIISGILSAFFA